MGVITSTGNAAVKAARKLARANQRDRAGLVLVEGPRPVVEAQGRLRRVFVTDEGRVELADLLASASRDGAEIVTVSARVLASIATTMTPQAVIGIAELPRPELEPALEAAAQPVLAVVLVGAQDPGNVGTVIRSADAAGADLVVLTAGSVDPGNPKAVRASAGSVFHLPVVTDVELSTLTAACRRRGIGVVGLDAGAEVALTSLDLSGPTALVLGNEGAGLDPAALAACDARAALPLHRRARPGYSGGAESLNLAASAAIAAYEVAGQRSARIGSRS